MGPQAGWMIFVGKGILAGAQVQPGSSALTVT
jgi:hypothetical protein